MRFAAMPFWSLRALLSPEKRSPTMHVLLNFLSYFLLRKLHRMLQKKSKTKLTVDDSQHTISSTHYQRNFFSIAYSAGLNGSETIFSMIERIAKKFIIELTGVDMIVFQ